MRYAARSSVIALALVAGLGCETEEPQPPDPNEPLPPVVCDEQAPISLVRTAADSALGIPPWLQACNVCPSDFTFAVADTELLTLRTAADTCAVAMPMAPWGEAESFDATLTVDDGFSTAVLAFEHPGTGDRGEDPDELGAPTYRLELAPERLRVPALDLLLLDGFDGSVLLHLEPTADHGFELSFAPVDPDTGEQDPCALTSTWAEPVRLDTRQLGAPASPGDRLPLPFGGPLKAGALQATISSTGSALQNATLLYEVDIDALAAEHGIPVDEHCDTVDGLGLDPLCAPCSNGDGTCVTAVWEWSVSPASNAPFVPVDTLPPECGEP